MKLFKDSRRRLIFKVNSNSDQMLEAKFQFHIHLMSNFYDPSSLLATDSDMKKS